MAGRTIIPTNLHRGTISGHNIGRQRTFYFSRSGAGAEPVPVAHGAFDRAFAFGAFVLLVAFYVALPSLKLAGMPLRGLLAVGLLGLMVVAYPGVAQKALRAYFPLMALAAGFAALGIFTSVANAAPLDVIVEIVIEVHLQILVIIFVAGMLAEICGARLAMLAIVGVIGASAIFALLQMLHVDVAWAIRRALGPLSKEELRPSIVDRRPPGLSYSPIQLSTQLCLAFGVFAAVRWADRIRTVGRKAADPAVIVALLVLAAGSIATATRSPILGGLIFLGLYLAMRRNSWLPMAIVATVAVALFAWPTPLDFVESNAPRVLRADDNSAAARYVFIYYGLRLFADNPLGYGFGFQPADLWTTYWPDLYMMRGSRGTQEHMLHNYPLSMLNIYGIGILLLAPLIFSLLRRAGPYLIFFIPYAVHIMFHNSGPFFSDTLIWFVIAAISAGGVALRSSQDRAPAKMVSARGGPSPVRVASPKGW